MARRIKNNAGEANAFSGVFLLLWFIRAHQAP